MAKQTITYVPQVLDLVLYAGDGVKFRLVVTDVAGAPVNLTGAMIAQVRHAREDADPADADFSIDLTEAALGVAILGLTGEQTHALVTSNEKFIGVWDLEWTAAGEEPMTLCQGKVECVPDVSH
jgi:hypothetical protein